MSGENVSREKREDKDLNFSPNSVETSSPRSVGTTYKAAPAKASKLDKEYKVAKQTVVCKLPYKVSSKNPSNLCSVISLAAFILI